MAYNLEFSSFF